LVATAIRETHEEVGVDLRAHGELLGRLDDVQAIARGEPMDLIIVPHVFLLRQSAPLTVQDSEVAEALWTPLAPMLRGDTVTARPYEHAGQRFELPGYQVGEHVVWGLTHRMLELLFAALRR
jgi:8-oxo-dGTP pyrophosphatase MutT (NUDIX family)